VDLRTGERTYSVTAVPITSTDRSMLVLLFDDQTERRRLQDQLIQSEKMSAIGQLIAGIAHELNNPLASVVGFADFLGEVPHVPPALREPLKVIQEEAERASNIVKNLLSFARKQEHQRRSTALRPLLDATFLLLRNQFMAHRVEAQIEIEPDLPMPDIDPNQIQQVFVNLLNNAAQAIASTGRPGRVIVRGRRWLDGVAIDVVDDGPGMSEALAAQVFEPFFTTKREHGGRIMLSTEEGRGSTFTVQLPLSTRPPAPTPDTGAGTSTKRLRVLVVDDEPHILHYMHATLEAWGHIPVVARDGREALEVADRERFDLVISDLRMPELGGREFYEELARRHPAVAARRVFSTGATVRGDTLAVVECLDRPPPPPFSLRNSHLAGCGGVGRRMTWWYVASGARVGASASSAAGANWRGCNVEQVVVTGPAVSPRVFGATASACARCRGRQGSIRACSRPSLPSCAPRGAWSMRTTRTPSRSEGWGRCLHAARSWRRAGWTFTCGAGDSGPVPTESSPSRKRWRRCCWRTGSPRPHSDRAPGIALDDARRPRGLASVTGSTGARRRRSPPKLRCTRHGSRHAASTAARRGSLPVTALWWPARAPSAAR
jgi:CheY-like chemotaxis protein